MRCVCVCVCLCTAAAPSVEDKYWNPVIELKHQLVELVEPDFGLLEQLLSNDVLTYRQVTQVTSCGD